LDPINLTIDGRPVTAQKGVTVLQAAQTAGIYVPTLCADPDMKPYGGCRLCVVEIEKMRGFPVACTTPAIDGMVIKTDTPMVMELRRMAMELILSDHPSQCLVCDRKERCGPFDICLRNVAVTDRCVTCPKNDHCEVQPIVKYLGITSLPYRHSEGCIPVDESNPFYYRDLNKCILCAKCVRTCDEIVGVNAIEIIHRGHDSKIGTLGDRDIIYSNCISCGECVVRCPVGALVPKHMEIPASEVASTCPYCGVGCGIYLSVREGHLTGVRARRDSPNKGNLCVKGRFGIVEFVHSADRLKSPLVRREDGYQSAGWDEALDLAANKLKSYKPEQVAVISSAKCSNEDNYVAQKLARAVLGTNSIDHCARV